MVRVLEGEDGKVSRSGTGQCLLGEKNDIRSMPLILKVADIGAI